MAAAQSLVGCTRFILSAALLYIKLADLLAGNPAPEEGEGAASWTSTSSASRVARRDELDGRSISSMLLAMPAGAYLRDEIKCTDSGLLGLCLGAMRVGSGV